MVFQDLLRIDLAIANGSFFKNEVLLKIMNRVKAEKSKLHLLGLVGAGGVHSNLSHLLALIKMASENDVKKLFLHLFVDGRDSPPTSASIYLAQVESALDQLGIGKIATLCGRYYALDRDYHWERTEKAYRMMVEGEGRSFYGATEAIKASYSAGITDEFIEPTILDKNGLIEDNDGIIFFNFRIDRPRQLTKALVLPEFEKLSDFRVNFDPYAEKYGQHLYQRVAAPAPFHRKKILKKVFMATMTQYESGLPVETVFTPELVALPLARVLAEKQLRQLRLGETEKERFVGYYFDGQRERVFEAEDRVVLPSPEVATYDLKPEMAAAELTEEFTRRLQKDPYHFTVINFANPDMVGHTGVIPAAVKACETVDHMVGKIVRLVDFCNGCCIITADHGNCEEMLNPTTGAIDTEHSAYPVPLIIVNKQWLGKNTILRSGVLADVTPTILEIMEIEKPGVMTGRSLLER